ncbi:MAG: TonB-dependent copper receptor [Magnetospirillum sp.]|nr:TonB-dependent copper receptor [Magnetospirillum sp.]
MASTALLAAVLPPLVAHAGDEPVTTLKEVVVTAPPMDEPLTVVTDPHNPRQPIPPADGAGYLKNIPGFSVARQAGIDGEPMLRSQGISRLNVLLDDTPVLGGCGNRMDPPTSYIFPESFDTMTVLKGPQSVVHGGTALGTVMVDREPPRFTDWGMRGNASALFGSWGRNDQVVDASAGGTAGFVRALGTHSFSDDYRDGRGEKVHSKYWRQSGTAMLGWTPNRDTVIEASFDRSTAQAAYAAKMMDGTKFDRQGGNVHVETKRLTPWLAKVEGTAYVNYVDHVMDTYSLRTLVLPAMGTTGMATQVDHLMAGGKAKVELTPVSGTRLTLGADYNRDEHTKRSVNRTQYLAGTTLKDQMRVRDISFDTWAGYGELVQELSGADRVIAGYRLTRVEAERNNVQPNLTDERTLHAGFGRFERDVDLGVPVTAYVGLGHVERAPDFWERNVNSSAASFLARTEKTNQLDLGALFRSGKWRGAASGFYADFTDYILVPSASNTNAKNVDAHTWGGEAELSYRLLPAWTVEATAAYVRGYNDSEHKPLAQIAPLDTTVGVKYDDDTFMAGLLLRAVTAQERVDVGWGNIASQDLAKSNGFAVLSANGGWRIADGITVTAGIDNILDKIYAEHISKTGNSSSMAGMDVTGYSDTVRVNEPGRTFWMRGSVKF